MARNNGSVGTVDIAASVEDMLGRVSRLKELGKVKAQLDKEQEKLDAEQSKVDAEIAELTGGQTPAPRQTRRKSAEGNKPRGNGNGTRVPLRNVLLKVLPTPDMDPITKDDIAALVEKEGYKTNAENPKVVIGQTLGKFRDFQNTERGKWRLSKFGVAARDKMIAEGNEHEEGAGDPEGVAEAEAAAPEAAPAAEATVAPEASAPAEVVKADAPAEAAPAAEQTEEQPTGATPALNS